MLFFVFRLVKGSVTPVVTVPPSGRCTKDQFLCLKPPTCIADWKRCDGHPHCQDGSDEANCRKCHKIWTHLLTLFYLFPHFSIINKVIKTKITQTLLHCLASPENAFSYLQNKLTEAFISYLSVIFQPLVVRCSVWTVLSVRTARPACWTARGVMAS